MRSRDSAQKRHNINPKQMMDPFWLRKLKQAMSGARPFLCRKGVREFCEISVKKKGGGGKFGEMEGQMSNEQLAGRNPGPR